MARDYHLGLVKESTFGTFVSPTAFIPAKTFSFDPAQQMEQGRFTGAGRALRYDWTTVLQPAMSAETLWWSEYMGAILRNAVQNAPTTTTPGGATNARLHTFKPSDTATLLGLSFEGQHTGSVANFMRGCVINSLEISADGQTPVNCSFDALGVDFVRASGTWSDAASAPSVTASPTYFANSIAPLMAWKTTVKIGGTVAVNGTTGYLDVTSGTANTSFKSFTLSMNNNLEHIKTFNNQVNPTTIHTAARDITLDLELDWETISNTFFDAWLANTTQVVEIIVTGAQIESGQNYTLKIVLPAAKVESALYPDGNGDISRPTQAITLVATEDSNGYDICFAIEDTQTSY